MVCVQYTWTKTRHLEVLPTIGAPRPQNCFWEVQEVPIDFGLVGSPIPSWIFTRLGDLLDLQLFWDSLIFLQFYTTTQPAIPSLQWILCYRMIYSNRILLGTHVYYYCIWKWLRSKLGQQCFFGWKIIICIICIWLVSNSFWLDCPKTQQTT